MVASNARTARPKKKTTREVFYEFIKTDKNGTPDVSAIFDKACFEAWLKTRSQQPQKPGESYRRALVSQLTASDGRRPFEPAIEERILERIRQKRRWPCFDGTKTTIGQHGCKRKGFHEGKALKEQKKQKGAHGSLNKLSNRVTKRRRRDDQENYVNQQPLKRRTSLDVCIPSAMLNDPFQLPAVDYSDVDSVGIADYSAEAAKSVDFNLDPLPYSLESQSSDMFHDDLSVFANEHLDLGGWPYGIA